MSLFPQYTKERQKTFDAVRAHERKNWREVTGVFPSDMAQTFRETENYRLRGTLKIGVHRETEGTRRSWNLALLRSVCGKSSSQRGKKSRY